MANETEILMINGVEYTLIDSTAVHTVDSGLSTSSSNPVQNKVIKAALDKKGTLISLSTATATALLDYYSFSVPAADITAINAAHDGVIISFGSSSAFGANETFVGFLNETTLWNGISYLAYSGTISAATSLDSNLFVLLLPKTGNGGTGYIKAKNVATKGDVGDALDDAEDYADTKIVAAIEALDAAVSGLGTGKTITALSETNGVILAEASDIAIAGSQVTSGNIAAARMPTGYMKEAYLEWGGKNFSAGNGPLDAALINTLGADRFAFIPGACITVEYSTDAGATWTDYGWTTAEKGTLFAPGIGVATYLGKHSSTGGSANDQLRITVDTYTTKQWVYSAIKKMCVYLSTNGASGLKWTCQVRTTANVLNNVDAWVDIFKDVDIAGYSGINITQTDVVIGSSAPTSTSNTQYRQFRYIFTQAAAHSSGRSAYIAYIMGFGGVGWSTPSPMAKVGSVYDYDRAQNVTFPARVKATELKGLGANYYGTCSTAAGTAAKVVTCTGFVLVAGARISVKFTNGSVSSSTTLNVNGTGAKSCSRIIYGSALGLAIRCNANEVLEFIYDGAQYIVLTPYALRNNFTQGSRPASANRSYADAGLEYFLATSVMTTGKPPFDAHILNMNWDNSNPAAAQLAVAHGADTHAGQLWTRGQIGTAATWTDWKEIPRLTSTPSDGQIMVSDQSTGLGLIKGGPALDTTDTTKFLRHDGSWAEIGGGVAPVEDSDVFLSRAVNFGENKYKFPSLVGGTVAWNQIAKELIEGNYNKGNGTAVYDNGTVSFTAAARYGALYCSTLSPLVNGHKYLINSDIKLMNVAGANTIRVAIGHAGYNQGTVYVPSTSPVNTFINVSGVVQYNPGTNPTNNYLFLQDNRAEVSQIDMKNLLLIDLTLALGPTIADYIYSLETTTTGAGVAWFKQYFPKSYYPFNAGALISVNPTGAETIGVNLFDKSKIATGYINNSSGNFVSNTAYKATDYISVIGNVDYYIKSDQTGVGWGAWYDSNKTYISGITGYISSASSSKIYSAPVNAAYMRLTIASSSTGDPDTFSVSVSNPLHNGTYYPYTSHSYPISPVELRGIPKLSAGKLAFDGDVRASDGTVTRKYGIVDLGTLSWGFNSQANSIFQATITGMQEPATILERLTGIMSSKYPVDTIVAISADMGDKTMKRLASNIYIRDTAYTTAVAFKTAMSGVYLVYELATPTTESSQSLPVPQVVYDGGTESYVDERDVQMPVGQDATYMDAASAIGELMDSGLVPSSSGGSSYSEGTFTAKYGTVSNTWNYYKEGNTVTVWGSISNATSMAAAVMTGLPFAARHKQVVSATCSGGSYICVSMDIRIESGSTQFAPSQMTYASTSGTSVQVMNSETMIFYTIGNTATLRFTYICQ